MRAAGAGRGRLTCLTSGSSSDTLSLGGTLPSLPLVTASFPFAPAVSLPFSTLGLSLGPPSAPKPLLPGAALSGKPPTGRWSLRQGPAVCVYLKSKGHSASDHEAGDQRGWDRVSMSCPLCGAQGGPAKDSGVNVPSGVEVRGGPDLKAQKGRWGLLRDREEEKRVF